MNQLTIRGLDPALAERIQCLSKQDGLSLNQVALRLLRRGAGLDAPSPQANVVGSTLDHLIGSWSADEAAAFEAAVADLRPIDRDIWQ